MTLLSPVNNGSEPPSADSANTMLDMVSNSPLYLSISKELKIVLLKCREGIAIDTLEWSNLMEEYLQLIKRYKHYPFSYACFETAILDVIDNSLTKKSRKWVIDYGDDIKKPGVLTFTNSDQLAEFLVGLPGFDAIYNESMSLLLQTNRSASAQFLFEIKKDEQKNTYLYEYRLFILIDRSIQYAKSVVQLMLSDTVHDLQTVYSLFIKFLPQGVSITDGLHRITYNKLLQKEQFDQRANDDEQYENAQLFDPQLGVLLNAYRDITESQINRKELFELVCQNEGWCFFIRQTNTMVTFSKLESIIKKRPMDTFRLFTPHIDDQNTTIIFEGQQINKEMKEMIIFLNNFLQDKIKWKNVNKMNYNKICLVIAGEIIEDDKVNITITFGGTELKYDNPNDYQDEYSIITFSINEFYKFLIALNYSFLDWDTINPFYLGYEPDNGGKEGLNDEDEESYDDK